MSIEARAALCSKLVFQKDSQKADLMDPELTNTNLIALLEQVVATFASPVLITAVRSDHHDDGPNGHAGGYCVDAWNADWETKGDHAVVGLMQACADSQYCWSVGVSGVAIQWMDEVKWPGYPFYSFTENAPDHIHIAAKSQTGGPGVRET